MIGDSGKDRVRQGGSVLHTSQVRNVHDCSCKSIYSDLFSHMNDTCIEAKQACPGGNN